MFWNKEKEEKKPKVKVKRVDVPIVVGRNIYTAAEAETAIAKLEGKCKDRMRTIHRLMSRDDEIEAKRKEKEEIQKETAIENKKLKKLLDSRHQSLVLRYLSGDFRKDGLDGYSLECLQKMANQYIEDIYLEVKDDDQM